MWATRMSLVIVLGGSEDLDESPLFPNWIREESARNPKALPQPLRLARSDHGVILICRLACSLIENSAEVQTCRSRRAEYEKVSAVRLSGLPSWYWSPSALLKKAEMRRRLVPQPSTSTVPMKWFGRRT